MAKAVQRICDAMKSAENGWKNFWQSHDWNFFKKQRVYLPVGMLTGVVMIILLV